MVTVLTFLIVLPLNLYLVSEVQWDNAGYTVELEASATMTTPTATVLPPLGRFLSLPHSALGRAWTQERLGSWAGTVLGWQLHGMFSR